MGVVTGVRNRRSILTRASVTLVFRSDTPHEVSEQYVLCYSRFSTPQPAEFDDAFTETARP